MRLQEENTNKAEDEKVDEARQRAEAVARIRAHWPPSVPLDTKERSGGETGPGGHLKDRCGAWEEVRDRYAAADPEGLFFRQAMGLAEVEEAEVWDGGTGDLMDLP